MEKFWNTCDLNFSHNIISGHLKSYNDITTFWKNNFINKIDFSDKIVLDYGIGGGYLGKYLFAFSIFWTYCWFSQYMLIWYANNGEETIYFAERLNNYKFLFIANLAINFLLPFFVLINASIADFT